MGTKTSRIGDIFFITDFVANGSFASLKENVQYKNEPDYAILVRLTDNTKKWNGNYVYVNESSYRFLSKSTVLPGDLIISNVGEPGIAFITPDLGQPMTLGPNSILVRKTNDEINIEYFYYLIKSPEGQKEIQKIVSKTTIRKFNKTGFRNISIPFPKLQVQLHTANILSQAENLIAQRKESIQLLDEFLKSTFLEMFGNPETNESDFPFIELEKLCKIIVDCPHSTPVKSEQKTNYPCIRTSELTNGYISWNSMQYLEESEYKMRIQRLVPEEGDIVYGREGTYGDAIRVPSGYKFSLGQRTMLFRPDYKKTNSIYLWAMVRSDFVYRQAKKKNSGSTVGHVNVKDIKQFRILNPPFGLQNDFAKQVQLIEILKSKYKSSLLELENLYGSLSQRAFKGELRVEDGVVMISARRQ